MDETDQWSIQEVARLAGTTSRTLRHYDDVGLLPPSSVGAGGHRRYDRSALVRLQRILLLRRLGLGLEAIADVLDGQRDEAAALAAHVDWLQAERARLARQIAAIEKTLDARKGGEQIMAEDMFDGFDNAPYKEEVERRWGADAYAASDAWWNAKSRTEKSEFERRSARLIRDWVDAAEREADPEGHEGQALAARQVAWFGTIPGIPGTETGGPTREFVACIGDLYVGDPRFAANYATSAGGTSGAEFVRDALRAYAERSM